MKKITSKIITSLLSFAVVMMGCAGQLPVDYNTAGCDSLNSTQARSDCYKLKNAPSSTETKKAVFIPSTVDFGNGISLEVTRVGYNQYGPRLVGSINNNSGKKWGRLELEVTVTDEVGIEHKGTIYPINSSESPFGLGSIPLVESLREKKEYPWEETEGIKIFSSSIPLPRVDGASLLDPDNAPPPHITHIVSIAPKGKFIDGYYITKYKISMLRPVVRPDPIYSDKDVDIVFMFTAGKLEGIEFSVRNKTNDQITLDWNGSSFVDSAGTAHRIFHGDIKLIDRNNPQPPSTIPPSSTLRDVIVPTSYVSWNGKYWHNEAVLPPGPRGELLKGGEIGVFLPLTIKGKQKPYNFRFKIENVEAEQ
jgi:hypothetical protein